MEDWFQLIIILLVVGGSALGPVLKKLIEAFTPKEGGSPKHSARPLGADPSQDQKTTSEPRRPQVHEEVPQAAAVPAPPRRRTTTAQQAPRRERQPAQPAPPSMPPPPRRRKPAPRPTSRPTVVTSNIENVEDPLGHLTSMVEQSGGAVEQASEQRLGHITSKIDDTGERLHDGIDEHLGHVESVAYARRSQKRSQARIPGFGRATPHALRQAVLLREILGPPLALRPPGEDHA